MHRKQLRTVIAGWILPALAQAQVGSVQIDQVRQFTNPLQPVAPAPAGAAEIPSTPTDAAADDAFGAQVLLKQQDRPRPFSGFAEAAAFFTNNVALAPRNALEDKFLVLSAGAAYARPLGSEWRFETSVRSALYRYEEFRELDFVSVDIAAGFTWAPPVLRGAEITARYLFTDLSTAEGGDAIYRGHSALLGIQKAVPFSRAHGVYFGLSAQWTWAEPQEPGRDEYSALAGYHLQIAEHFAADVTYRYAYFVYREDEGRREHNHTLSLSLRYAPREWIAGTISTFFAKNDSNRELFDYEVLNAGIGLQFSIRF